MNDAWCSVNQVSLAPCVTSSATPVPMTARLLSTTKGPINRSSKGGAPRSTYSRWPV